MRKHTLIGAGLGLLLLAFVAIGSWMAGRASEPQAVVAAPVMPPRAAAPPAAAPGLPGSSAAVAVVPSSGANRERRRRISEVRAELNALRAQGMKAPPEKLRSLVNELEALSPPGIDPRYFQALRSMLESSGKVQALSDELQGLKGSSPAEMARKEAILAEMRTLGERVSADARSLQGYVTPAVPLSPASSAATAAGAKAP